MRTQIYIIFEKDTPQSVIDEWVRLHGASIYWTEPSAMHLALAAEEGGWTFPHIITEDFPE